MGLCITLLQLCETGRIVGSWKLNKENFAISMAALIADFLPIMDLHSSGTLEVGGHCASVAVYNSTVSREFRSHVC
jgi:hypothetical protein